MTAAVIVAVSEAADAAVIVPVGVVADATVIDALAHQRQPRQSKLSEHLAEQQSEDVVLEFCVSRDFLVFS